jgi:hypothetical protein
MLRFIGWLLALVIGLTLALAAGAYYLLSDPNKLKPQLTALIEQQTGVPVSIDGELHWQLFPPLTLRVEQISASHEGSDYSLASLNLDLDLRSVIANQDLNQWQIRSLELDELIVQTELDQTRIDYLKLNDFAFNQASPFETRLNYQASDAEVIPLDAHGQLVYRPDSDQIQLIDTRFETDLTSGLCNVDATIGTASSYIDPVDAVIPISIWRSYDWQGTCVLDAIEMAGERFENLRLELSNQRGDSTTTLSIPEFFGGSATAKIDINAERDQVAWRIAPDLNEVDSQALVTWLDQRLTWVAPLAYGGAITMTGNTEEELIRSISGKTEFNGGKGTIDVSRIKQPLLALATLLREDQHIRKWPELWQYERFIGEWSVNGTQHAMDFALDNLTAAIAGVYDPLTDALDIQLDIVFEDNPGMHSFDVNPLLVGLPIPLRCRGTLEEPSCAVDQAAAQRIIASALTSEKGDELRDKIEEKIDEQVPEEYRDAAKNLLDIFSRSAAKPAPDA